jgi:hypothetical protein
MEKRSNAAIERYRRQLVSVLGAHGVLGVVIGGKGTRTPDL